MKYYLQEHIESRYLPEALIRPGLQKYRNYTGWEDYYIGRHLVFSHRRTDYSASMFPEKLHSHRFFEMDIYITGQISYISDDQEMLPHKDDILLVPPGCMHTARLLDLGPYERYVFYTPRSFSPRSTFLRFLLSLRRSMHPSITSDRNTAPNSTICWRSSNPSCVRMKTMRHCWLTAM